MMHQPSPFHVGDAAASCQKPAFTLPRFFITGMCEIAFLACVLILPWYFALYDLPPQFSVQLAPVGRGTADASAASPAAGGSAAFYVALHASNRRATERCYRGGGEAAVAFAGFNVASGRVPGFCVEGKGRREVPFLARDDGVRLPEHLRDRMAAAHKVGALELEVQVKLFQSGKPVRMWCKARVDGAQQPPDMTMCTVFALQNRFDMDA
ncbi:hypothetical protein ACP4OV_030350 [Aristida adscensionis]